MTRLLLIRHGQSEWNAIGRWQGRADPPLSDLGRAQARSAVERFATVGSVEDAVVTSPLQRARVTGEILAEGLGLGETSVDDLLVERDAGEWSGMTRSEIDEHWPGYLRDGRWPPGFESHDSVLDRGLRALATLRDRFPDGTVAAVSHGGLMYAIERHAGHPERGRIPNLGGWWMELATVPYRCGDRLVLVDDDSVTLPGQL